jgi:hypothetical protein
VETAPAIRFRRYGRPRVSFLSVRAPVEGLTVAYDGPLRNWPGLSPTATDPATTVGQPSMAGWPRFVTLLTPTT